MSTPNPVQGGQDRDFACVHYDDCLDVAVRRAWKGFDCIDCPLRGAAHEDPKARLEKYALQRDPERPGIAEGGFRVGPGTGGVGSRATALVPPPFVPAAPVEPTYEDPATLPAPVEEGPMETAMETPRASEPLRVDPEEIEAHLDRETLLQDVQHATEPPIYDEALADGSHIVERTPIEQARRLANEIRDLDRRRATAVAELAELRAGLAKEMAGIDELLGPHLERAGEAAATRFQAGVHKTFRRALGMEDPSPVPSTRPRRTKERAAPARTGTMRARILGTLQAHKTRRLSEITEDLDADLQSVSGMLSMMAKAGEVVRIARGVYKAAA